MTVNYRIGDWVEVMKELPENHFDACVTDPPYGLEFMGKEWDKLTRNTMRADSKADIEYRKVNNDINNPKSFLRDRPDIGGSLRFSIPMQQWHQVWATELLRVLKPGAHALVFGGTRTHHRLMCALEDAGFEIRDCLMFLYGSGFPKSLNPYRSMMGSLCRLHESAPHAVRISPWLLAESQEEKEPT